jgi:Fe-S-cluster containining protein
MTDHDLPDQSACDGCTRCRHRCVNGIPLTRAEFDALKRRVLALAPDVAARVLGPVQRVPWPGAEDDATYEPCRFLNLETGLCEVYASRPLICRLFGYVEWLPCPTGAVTCRWAPGVEIMRRRAGEPQKTWEEWCAEERAGS